MPDAIYNIINSNAFSGIGGLLIGLIVGQRLQIWLSRRTEYNELADKLFLNVDREIQSHHGHHFNIPDDDIKLIRRRMGTSQRKLFDAAISQYRTAAEKQCDDNGHVHFTNPEEVNAALKRIASILHRK